MKYFLMLVALFVAFMIPIGLPIVIVSEIGKTAEQTIPPMVIHVSPGQSTAALIPTPSTGVSGGLIEQIVSVAQSWLGTPYLWGGCSHRGVDCSCFVMNVLAAVGIQAPRTTITQVAWATPISQNAIRAGDLIFFDNTCTGCGPNPTHVGMSLGGDLMIDAGDPVKIEHVYWSKLHSIGRPRGL